MLMIEENKPGDRILNELMLWKRKEILLGNQDKAERITKVRNKIAWRIIGLS